MGDKKAGGGDQLNLDSLNSSDEEGKQTNFSVFFFNK